MPLRTGHLRLKAIARRGMARRPMHRADISSTLVTLHMNPPSVLGQVGRVRARDGWRIYTLRPPLEKRVEPAEHAPQLRSKA